MYTLNPVRTVISNIKMAKKRLVLILKYVFRTTTIGVSLSCHLLTFQDSKKHEILPSFNFLNVIPKLCILVKNIFYTFIEKESAIWDQNQLYRFNTYQDRALKNGKFLRKSEILILDLFSILMLRKIFI